MMVTMKIPETNFIISSTPFCLFRYDEVGGCKDALDKLREVSKMTERVE